MVGTRFDCTLHESLLEMFRPAVAVNAVSIALGLLNEYWCSPAMRAATKNRAVTQCGCRLRGWENVLVTDTPLGL